MTVMLVLLCDCGVVMLEIFGDRSLCRLYVCESVFVTLAVLK